MSDHYFSAEPATPDERRPLRVRLAGRTLDLVAAPGVFSADRLDKATRILLAEAPAPPPAGTILDLGCGWGPIALDAALRAPGARVWAVDVNARARDLAAVNAERVGAGNLTVAAPGDVPGDLVLDQIRSNPPIRIGKEALHELLLTWLPRLAPDGEAHLVVGKNLGADSLQRWLAAQLPDRQCVRTASSQGFRVLTVR